MIRSRGVAAHAAALSAVLVATLVACRQRQTSTPGSVAVLASRFPEAEIRSDGFDLAFLVKTGAFRWPDWREPTTANGVTTIWSQTQNAALELPVATGGPKLLTLRAHSHRSLGPSLPLRIRVGDVLLAELALTPKDTDFDVTLAVPGHAAGPLRLVFEVPRLYKPPSKARIVPRAGVALTGLQVSRVDSVAARSLPSLEGRTIVLPPASSLSFFVRLGRGGQLAARASGGPGEIEAWLETEVKAASLGGRSTAAGASRRLDWPLSATPGFARVELRNTGPRAVRLDDAVLAGVDEAPPPPLRPARLKAPPSIVVFLTDTLRADRLSTYGFSKATSPNLDAFAREAIRFDDVWAQSSWTRPTVSSIFTGVHPATHGAIGFDRPLAPRFTTLAEVFKRAGYRTAALVSNHVVHHRAGMAQGFDEWNDGVEKLYGIVSREVVERGLRFVDKAPRPFLLYLHTLEPHATYEPSDEAYRLFVPAGQERQRSRPLLMMPTISRRIANYLDGLYQGEIWDNDRSFGALIGGLRQRGLLDSTLVLFTADHGEEFLDHGDKGHGHSLYNELIRVPLLVRLPGGRRGGTHETATVAQVDLLPTLASLAGIAAPPCEGRDLSGLWLGREQAVAPPELVSETRMGTAEKEALRVGDLKVIVNHDPRLYGSAGGPTELYDLAQDRAETVNLAPRRRVATAWMKRRLAALLASKRNRSSGAERLEITDEDREALKALGYVN